MYDRILTVLALIVLVVLVGGLMYYCPPEDLDELVEALAAMGMDE